mgnify:CR=1 FL=1
MLIMSIANDIKFGVLDILRSIGMGLVNIIFDTNSDRKYGRYNCESFKNFKRGRGNFF